MRWRDVDLLAGVVRIPESKTEEGERSIALAPTLVRVLSDHYAASRYRHDDDYVFAHPQRGSMVDHEWSAERFRAALTAAGISDRVRPFHDLRHASLTNGAAAGEQPIELMARAGHRSMATTRQYVDLAGVTFPDAAAALERRLLGGAPAEGQMPSAELGAQLGES